MAQHQEISLLIAWDEAYHNGDALVEDFVYDQAKLKAQKKYPNDPYFMQVGSDVRGGKVKLPYTMGSLDQVQEGDTAKWVAKYSIQKEDVVVSDKEDGASILLQYNDGALQIAYTRGNGVQGADITRHVKKMKSVPQTVPTTGHFTVRGELIMSNDKFKANWAEVYKNPRNLVAGSTNRKVTDQELLDDIDLFVYQIVDGSSNNITSTQTGDLQLLESLGFMVVPTVNLKGHELTDQFLSKLLKLRKKESSYELDGLVLTINEKVNQKNLSSSSSLNPEHSVKYKVLDSESITTSTVVAVHWELSQHGFYKPRVEILPVPLFGTTVTFATGFNGRFINDNGIGPGAVIKITKGGSVIPDIVDVVEEVEPSLPEGAWHWNKTGTEIRVDNYDTNPTVVFNQVLEFFKSLDVELLKEATLKNLIGYLLLEQASYETIITEIAGLLESQWVKYVGTNGSKIYASLQRRLSAMPLETFLGSVKYMGFGFGKRKAKALLRGLDSPEKVWSLTITDIEEMDGFDTTAAAIVEGLPKAKLLLEALDIQTVEEVKTDELAALNVVFTGFRDKEFQDKLEKAGAKVGSSVSKKTTHVLTAEPNSTSSKAKKARELGIATMSLDEFKDMFNL